MRRDGPMWASAPTKSYIKCGGEGSRKIRPYGDLPKGMCGGVRAPRPTLCDKECGKTGCRGRRPLRIVTSSTVRWVTARVAPRPALHFCRAGPVCPAGSAAGRADVGIGPYEKLHKVWWGEPPQGPPLREFAERYVWGGVCQRNGRGRTPPLRIKFGVCFCVSLLFSRFWIAFIGVSGAYPPGWAR